MHPLAQTLLDAHTRQLLQQLSTEQLQQTVPSEITAVISAIADRPIVTLVDLDALKRLLRQQILQRPAPDLLRQINLDLARHLLALPLQRQTRVADLVASGHIETLIDRLLDLEDLRRDVVNAVLASPVYSDVLSDLLYNGIRDYLLEDNILTKKVPGMSSLMKLGKGMVNRMGGLEEGIERTIKQTIAKNLRASLELSEQLIEKACKGPRLRQTLLEAWTKARGLSLDKFTAYVGERELVDTESMLHTFWEDVRQTPYASTLLNAIVDAIAASLAELTLAQTLAQLDLDVAAIGTEVLACIEPALAQLRQSGHLEQRLRAHLSLFYASPEVTQLLS